MTLAYLNDMWKKTETSEFFFSDVAKDIIKDILNGMMIC